jgi:septal ring factor EnvC (AmiA/AmiB activator)
MIACTIVLAGCIAWTGCTSARARVEQSRQQSASQFEELESARNRIARMDAERTSLRREIADLQNQLKTRDQVQDIMQKRLAGAKREGERLQTELASAVLLSSADGSSKTRENPAERETFRLPAGLIGRLNQIATDQPRIIFDRQLKALRFPGDLLFGQGDSLLPAGRQSLESLARALKQPDSQNLKLLISVQVDPENRLPRALENTYPTDWHLAAHQAIAIHQFLERHGLLPANVGVSVQQYPVGSPANDRPRVEIYLNEPDVNVE